MYRKQQQILSVTTMTDGLQWSKLLEKDNKDLIETKRPQGSLRLNMTTKTQCDHNQMENYHKEAQNFQSNQCDWKYIENYHKMNTKQPERLSVTTRG